MQDDKCICDIIDLYKEMIMAAGYRALHDFHMAEDVFQITMLKLLNTERNMEDMRSARTRSFIYAVARNTAIDMYRKNQDVLNSSRPAATSIKSIKRKKKTDSFAPALTNMSSNTALAKIFPIYWKNWTKQSGK